MIKKDKQKDKQKEKEIESYAQLQFTRAEVAVIASVDERDLHDDGKYALAFQKGRLNAQAVVRKVIFDDASQGEVQAQKQFIDLVANSQTPEIDRKIKKILKKMQKHVCAECAAGVVSVAIENLESKK